MLCSIISYDEAEQYCESQNATLPAPLSAENAKQDDGLTQTVSGTQFTMEEIMMMTDDELCSSNCA